MLEWKPLVSVLMPTYNTPEKWLRRSIESVRAQIYPNWELCIADDASNEPHVRSVLEEYARLDERIKITFRESNGHISVASNTSLDLATGDYVALLDHDDEIPAHALYMVAAAVNENLNLDLIYSDEDKINESGRRFRPHFKPDWNPDLLTAQNMVSHLGVYRTEVVRQVGGFREGYEGSQDWDLALRVSEVIPADHIYHIPHVLYHWRTVRGSTSVAVKEKSYAIKAGLAAVQDHLERKGDAAQVELVMEKYIRVRYALPNPLPLVSIIIPTRNGLQLLRQCIDSICNKTRYSNYEIIVVDNQSDDADTLDYLASIDAKGIAKVVNYNKPFNFSKINNYALLHAQGDLLCLMNNDVEVISEDWLEEMASHAVRKEIGAVGAMLYYPNDIIQHAGVLIGMGGLAGHLYAGFRRGESGYMERARIVQNLSAVTAACLVIRKSIYEEVNGLEETNLTVAFNDVDFCLRVMERGYRNLWTPFAELYHHESASRGPEDTPEKQQRFRKEIAYMRSRWPHLVNNDPAYNPNLTLDSSWPYLATVPRVNKPW
jgi:glycosyltransferase involved in cell wall biosynthesis